MSKEKHKATDAAADAAKDAPSPAKAATDAERDQAVRRVSAAFCQSIPDAARSTGNYDAPEDDTTKYPVPDGKYRVVGCDWVVRFSRGAWRGAERAHARSAPDWIDIPDHG